MKLNLTIVTVISLTGVLTACDSKSALDNKILTIESAISPTLVIRGENLPAVSIEERMKQLDVPALSVAVINGGELEWAIR